MCLALSWCSLNINSPAHLTFLLAPSKNRFSYLFAFFLTKSNKFSYSFHSDLPQEITIVNMLCFVLCDCVCGQHKHNLRIFHLTVLCSFLLVKAWALELNWP